MDHVTPPLGLYLPMCKMATYFTSQEPDPGSIDHAALERHSVDRS